MKKLLKIALPLLLLYLITVLKLQFPEVLGSSTPFLLYTGLIVFVTVYSGWIMGCLITFLSILPITYYFLEPQYSFTLTPKNLIQILFYLLQDFFVVWISMALKKANQKNVEAEQRFKLLAEWACDLLILRDGSGKATYVSPKVLEIYGYSPEEYTAMPLEELVAAECLEDFKKSMSEIVSTPNEHRVLRTKAKKKSGELIWLEGDVYNFLDQPAIRAVVSHIRDITARVDLEKQKDDFIGIASHELKTPLANIKGFVSLAGRSVEAQSQAAVFLDKAQHNINRLQKLASDLLDISKINSGQLPYTIQSFDVAELARATVESMQMHYTNYQFELKVPDSIVIEGDKYRIEQVLVNLLDNAVKYSPDNNRIIIKAHVSNSFVIFDIQDFGIGISDEHVSKIFDRFYRVDNTSTKYQGLGLGLFIVSEIVKTHRGSFWINSSIGEGSTFSFLLPVSGSLTQTEETDRTTYYRADFISIKHNPEKGWLEADWLGYQTLETVQKGCMEMLDLVKKTAVNKILNDNSKVKGNWSEAADWGSEIWFPLMEQAGIKQFAWIQSPERFSQLAALKSIDLKNGEIDIHFCENKKEALDWLEQAK